MCYKCLICGAITSKYPCHACDSKSNYLAPRQPPKHVKENSSLWTTLVKICPDKIYTYNPSDNMLQCLDAIDIDVLAEMIDAIKKWRNNIKI